MTAKTYMKSSGFRIYKRALKTIREHGYEIKHDFENPALFNKAQTDFVNRIVWIGRIGGKSKELAQIYVDSLIVHEAHHVLTAKTRLMMDAFRPYDELLAWFIEDERQAHTKQLIFLGYFNPMWLTCMKALIPLKLRRYYRGECRGQADQALEIQARFRDRGLKYSDYLEAKKVEGKKAFGLYLETGDCVTFSLAAQRRFREPHEGWGGCKGKVLKVKKDEVLVKWDNSTRPEAVYRDWELVAV